MKLDEDIENVEFLLRDLRANDYNYTFIKSIETLLDEFKKLKEENKILQANGFRQGLYEKDCGYIPKKKIEDKIEEWDKSIKWNNADDHYYAIKILRELLNDKQTINNQEEFIKNECSKCKNTNKEECNIVQKINGEYDCINKK